MLKRVYALVAAEAVLAFTTVCFYWSHCQEA